MFLSYSLQSWVVLVSSRALKLSTALETFDLEEFQTLVAKCNIIQYCFNLLVEIETVDYACICDEMARQKIQ